MAKIAYGKREDIQQAIDNGVIPENTTIITNETEPELLFYDKNKKLKTIDEKSRFYSLIEVSQWLEKYDCGGLFFSVYDKGKWTPYVINHENEMIPFAELYDDTPLKEQIELLIKENESQNIQISEIFKILEEIEQVQTGKQFIFKGSYSETNLAEEIKNNPPELGDVYQVLDCNSWGINYGDLFYTTGEIATEEEKEWYESNGEPICSSSFQSIISGYKFIQIGNGCSLWNAINDLLLEIHDNFAIIQDENGGFYAGNVGKIKSGAVTIGNNASSHHGTEKSVIIGANTSVNSHGDAIIIGGHSDCDDNAIVVGIGSNAHSGNSIVIGHNSDSGDGGVAMGHNAETSGGVVLGNEATTLYHDPIENYDFGIPAIQIGKGNNPNAYTAQLYNYQLLSTDNASVTSEKWLTDVGKLSDLETNDKTSIVSAINEEINDRLSECELLWNDLGEVSELKTTDKTSIVSAINELVANGGSGGGNDNYFLRRFITDLYQLEDFERYVDKMHRDVLIVLDGLVINETRLDPGDNLVRTGNYREYKKDFETSFDGLFTCIYVYGNEYKRISKVDSDALIFNFNDLINQLNIIYDNRDNIQDIQSVLEFQVLNVLDDKADNVSIYNIEDPEETSLSFEFSSTYNTEIRARERTAISLTFGNGAYEEDYTSGLSFDSGETPTAIDYTNSGILNWVGTDCAMSDGLSIFQPSSNTHYDIVFYFNGRQFIGLVNGFVPSIEWQGSLAEGNEAV